MCALTLPILDFRTLNIWWLITWLRLVEATAVEAARPRRPEWSTIHTHGWHHHATGSRHAHHAGAGHAHGHPGVTERPHWSTAWGSGPWGRDGATHWAAGATRPCSATTGPHACRWGRSLASWGALPWWVHFNIKDGRDAFVLEISGWRPWSKTEEMATWMTVIPGPCILQIAACTV